MKLNVVTFHFNLTWRKVCLFCVLALQMSKHQPVLNDICWKNENINMRIQKYGGCLVERVLEFQFLTN